MGKDADPLGRGPGGMLPGPRDPRGAWRHFKAQVDGDPTARAIILNLAGTPEGRASLERSRQAWALHGLPAPFDALLREELGEGPPLPPGVATCAACGLPLVLSDLGYDHCAGCRLA